MVVVFSGTDDASASQSAQALDKAPHRGSAHPRSHVTPIVNFVVIERREKLLAHVAHPLGCHLASEGA